MYCLFVVLRELSCCSYCLTGCAKLCSTYFVVDRPLPTFLKNKKKRKPIVSDGSDVERTPPASPTDDSLVSYRLH